MVKFSLMIQYWPLYVMSILIFVLLIIMDDVHDDIIISLCSFRTTKKAMQHNYKWLYKWILDVQLTQFRLLNNE